MQHILYRMKIMLRQKSLIFWSLAFPIILGFMFYIMFGSITDKESFSEIPVGVEGKEEQDAFLLLLKETEVEKGTKMFKVIEYDSREEAMKALEKEKIDGFVDLDEGLELTVKKSGIAVSIIRTFINQYKQNTALFEKLAKEHPERIEKVAASLVDVGELEIREIPLKGIDKDPYTQYFFALISMACLIGSMVGLHNGNDIQADLSTLGARRNVAPTQKLKQVLCDFIGTYIIYCIMIAIILMFCIFVFKQDFGSNVWLVLLGGCVGSFTGIATGTMIAVLVKGAVQKKEAICTAFFMGSSFLGGLQWGNITYVLERNCPIINRINPATLLVNAFKSMAVFGDYKQYWVNMLSLFLIGFLCFGISIWKMRRVKYASL